MSRILSPSNTVCRHIIPMIKTLTILSVLSGHFCAPDSDALTSFLQALDADTRREIVSDLNANSELSVFSPPVSLLERTGWPWSTSSRRRSSPSYPACENPNDDSATSGCLQRRYDLLLSDYAASASVPDSNGLTIMSAAMSLRQNMHNLDELVKGVHSRVDGLYVNTSDSVSGTIPVTSSLVKRLINLEAGLGISANNAWMTLVNATGVAESDMGNSTQIAVNSTGGIADWFSIMQASEDSAATLNLDRIVKYMDYYFQQYAIQLTNSSEVVWNVLNDLNEQMVGIEGSTSNVADALTAAADNLKEQLDKFAESFDDMGGGAVDDVNRKTESMINQFQTQMDTAIDSVRMVANNKLQTSVTATNLAVNDQQQSYSQLNQQLQNDTKNLGDSVAAAQAKFASFDGTGAFDAVADKLSDLISNATQVITAGDNDRRGNLTVLASTSSDVKARVQTLWNDLSRNGADAEASRMSLQTDTGSAVSATLATYDEKHQSQVQAAQSFSDSAVDSVGTNSKASLDNMNLQYNNIQDSLASRAHDAARASKQSAGSLSSTAASGNFAISSASNAVQSGMSNSLSSNLGSLVGLAGSTGVATGASQVLASGQADQAKTAAAALAAAAANTDGPSLQAALAAGNTVNDLLASLLSSGMSSQAAIDKITNALDAIQSASSNTASTARKTEGSISGSLADLSNSVADSDDSMSRILQQGVDSLSDMTGVGVATNSPIGLASDLVSQGSVTVDQSAGLVSQASNVADSAIGDSSATIAGLSGQADSYANGQSNDVNNQVLSANANVDQAVAGTWGSAYTAVSSQANSLSQFQASSAIKLRSISMSQLEQVRAVAASVDSLMKQMNSFLSTNNAPLYAQVSNLPGLGQKLFLRMDALSRQASHISDIAQFSYKTKDPEVLVKGLFDQVRAYASNAAGVLSSIGSSFNSSANAYSSNFTGQVNDLAGEFAAAAASMKLQLGNLANSASGVSLSLANAPGGPDVINNLIGIQSKIGDIASTMGSALGGVDSNVVGSAPATLPSLLTQITGVQSQAGVEAVAISKTLDTLQQTAKSQVKAVGAIQQSASDGQNRVDNSAALAKMNEGIANSRLAAQKAAIDKLQADSKSVAGGLMDAVNAQVMVKANQADGVYDSVLAVQSQVSKSMGAILNSIGSLQSSQSSVLSISDNANQVNIQNMRNSLNGMMSIFNTYMSSAASQFAASDADRSNFVRAMVLDVQKLLGSTDASVQGMNQKVADYISQVNKNWGSFQGSNVDSSTSRLDSLVNDWATAEGMTLAAAQSNEDGLNGRNVFDYSPVTQKLNQVLIDVAKNGINLLKGSGLTVPQRLVDISNGIDLVPAAR